MFSTPYVVATALLHGVVSPAGYGAGDEADVRALARRVSVVAAADIDARLPAERAARVSVTLTDGTVHSREVPNPVGDADHHPFDADTLVTMLSGLLGSVGYVERCREAAEALGESSSARSVLDTLADP
jgi:2-methylcitrate dehydratase PrpD